MAVTPETVALLRDLRRFAVAAGDRFAGEHKRRPAARVAHLADRARELVGRIDEVVGRESAEQDDTLEATE